MSAPGTTPGPWQAIKGIVESDEMRCGVVAVRGDRQYMVATVENGAPGDFCATEWANARQMAASPALYRALEAMVEQHAARSLDDGQMLGADDQSPEVNAAIRALALARGEGK